MTMATVIDFTTRRAVAQAAPAPATARPPAPKPVMPAPKPRPNAAKIVEKGRISRDANKTADEIWALSYELGDLKRASAAALDAYGARVEEVTDRTASTVHRLRNEAHDRVESGGGLS